MMKTLERSLLLHVGKMVIPFKFGDQCDPLRAKGKKGNQAKRSHDLGTGAGQRWPVSDSCAFFRDARRRNQFQRTSSVPVRGGMIRGRFPGLAKKQEDAIDRDRHPLLELRQMDHEIQVTFNGRYGTG